MLGKAIWNYTNKGLLAILSVLIVFSLASIIFLVYTLQQLNSQLTTGSGAIGSAFVLQDLSINLRAIESASRGYVLTGDRHFLRSYDTAIRRIRQDIKIIKENEPLNLSQEQVRQIEDLVAGKVRFVERTVQEHDRQGRDAALALIATRQGDDLMERLESELNEAASVRLQNIGPRQQQSEENVRLAIWVAALTAIFILGTSAAVIRHFQRAILRERALENTKNEFLSLASHQLRTPATNVKQYIGMLMDGYMGELTEQQRHALQIAYKNNESEIAIMNNLLDVAKLDLNRIQINRKMVDIAKLARHVVDDYQKIAAERQQSIRFTADGKVMAPADAEYIKGVIENLIDNALKYSRENTQVTVTVFYDDDSAVIAVRDQGLGIRKRDYSKLFNKFSRLDNDFSANSEGSGLGLYWVKQIVALHNGNITLSSKMGKGSVFSIYLPLD